VFDFVERAAALGADAGVAVVFDSDIPVWGVRLLDEHCVPGGEQEFLCSG